MEKTKYNVKPLAKDTISNEQHKCEICQKVFKTQKLQRKHFSTVHDNKGELKLSVIFVEEILKLK